MAETLEMKTFNERLIERMNEERGETSFDWDEEFPKEQFNERERLIDDGKEHVFLFNNQAYEHNNEEYNGEFGENFFEYEAAVEFFDAWVWKASVKIQSL